MRALAYSLVAVMKPNLKKKLRTGNMLLLFVPPKELRNENVIMFKTVLAKLLDDFQNPKLRLTCLHTSQVLASAVLPLLTVEK